jgi:hypothetical protein
MVTNEISISELQEFVAEFWYHYDEGHYDELVARLADDVHYASRTDTGTTEFEEFVRVDVHGRAETIAWLTEHRNGSPYPLRHNGTNIFRTGSDGAVTTFRSYIFVTQVTNGVPFAVSSAIVDGGVGRGPSGLVLTSMTVILDTRESAPFSSLVEGAADAVAH